MAPPEPHILLCSLTILVAIFCSCDGAIPSSVMKEARKMNKRGPYLGLVVPNAFEMNPLLQSANFVPDKHLAYLDCGGKRFRFGSIAKKKVVMVMTGLSMLNAGLATQLLLNLFRVEGIVHFGIAGNADPNLQVGDVTIPREWAHLGLWSWQRYGDGPEDKLPSEEAGDFTRKNGRLQFSDFNNESNVDNFLNSVWYQREEIFPTNGVPEVRQMALWVPADKRYLSLSENLQGIRLERCVNSSTCLPRSPIVVEVARGCSANTFVDNAAYRQFLRDSFNITSIDMETAAVALVSLQHSIPFIALRSLSDLAGGGSAESNEVDIFGDLAATNAVAAVVEFVSLLK